MSGSRHETIVRVGGMPWIKTGATHHHARVELLKQMSCNQIGWLSDGC